LNSRQTLKKDKTMTDGYIHTSPNYIIEIANKADKVIIPLIKIE
jgi:hypothetical protein